MAYYKKLFGKEDMSDIKLREDFWEEDEKVSLEENQILS
jgi:hypothetical protein